MERNFTGIGSIRIEKLTEEKAPEVIELILSVYKHENIWPDYLKSDLEKEVFSSFQDTCYKPVFFIALYSNKIIGVASYMESHISSEAFELSFATVLPEYQGHGIGTYLTHIRLKEIAEREKDAFIITRTRFPRIFEKFNFKYIQKTLDSHGSNGPYDYMFCLAKDVVFDHTI